MSGPGSRGVQISTAVEISRIGIIDPALIATVKHHGEAGIAARQREQFGIQDLEPGQALFSAGIRRCRAREAVVLRRREWLVELRPIDVVETGAEIGIESLVRAVDR